MHGLQTLISYLVMAVTLFKSGGHGTRTRNPLRGI
jgi:hypothetical protein